MLPDLQCVRGLHPVWLPLSRGWLHNLGIRGREFITYWLLADDRPTASMFTVIWRTKLGRITGFGLSPAVPLPLTRMLGLGPLVGRVSDFTDFEHWIYYRLKGRS